MSNTDKVVDYILKNVGRLKADKIKALGSVVEALGGEVDETEKVSNEVPPTDEDDGLATSQPIDMTKVKGVKFDDGLENKIKVYG